MLYVSRNRHLALGLILTMLLAVGPRAVRDAGTSSHVQQEPAVEDNSADPPGIGGPEIAGDRGEPEPWFYHVVQPGETVWRISRQYGLKIDTVIRVNGLDDSARIYAGQRLIILREDGTVHRVQPGETLWQIASQYDLDIADVVVSNHLVDPNQLSVGQVLVLPGVTSSTLVQHGSRPTRQVTAGLLWPVFGRLSSPFGPRWGRMHNGIDLAVPFGTPIKAAQSGTVITAGWMGGYGRTVIIRHDNGLVTLYAHASRLLVKRGERIQQGQIIARVGSSGNSTGPHLHFEVVVNNRPQNPLRFLR